MNENNDLEPLSEAEIKSRLAEFPGWEYKDNKIIKTYEFKSFSDGINFLVELTPFCNELDHHPDIDIRYKKVTFYLTRYSIGGKVVKRDFIVANKIEELFGQYQKNG